MSAKSSVGEEAVEWGRIDEEEEEEEEEEAAFIEETPTPLYLSTTIWGRWCRESGAMWAGTAR